MVYGPSVLVNLVLRVLNTCDMRNKKVGAKLESAGTSSGPCSKCPINTRGVAKKAAAEKPVPTC